MEISLSLFSSFCRVADYLGGPGSDGLHETYEPLFTGPVANISSGLISFDIAVLI